MTHMMGHSHVRSALLAAIGFVALAYSATESRGAVILPDVPAGTRYEILFVTLDTIAPTSTDINTYNSFASTQANLSPALASLGVQWHAVGTTPTADALFNAPDNSIAVYNTQGIELATTTTGIYNGSLLSPVQFNQFGSSETAANVWTGTQPDGGNALGDWQLGYGGPVIDGNANVATGSWIDNGPFSEFFGPLPQFPVYALSSPVPEPATIALVVSALLAIGAMRLVRRRART